MTVIVWDGVTLAADKQCQSGEMVYETTKIAHTPNGEVMAYAGPVAEGLAMMDWYAKGADPDLFPESQKGQDWAVLVVAAKHGVKHFENVPVPVPSHGKRAWGSGKDFAMGALQMGATAEQAVQAANAVCVSCGFGVDTLTPAE